jgi:hypothetical protein
MLGLHIGQSMDFALRPSESDARQAAARQPRLHHSPKSLERPVSIQAMANHLPDGYDLFMHNLTWILSSIEQGDPQAAEQLLPLVYEELRKLAAQKLALEAPGLTLQATALVHEAYLRLVDGERQCSWPTWDSRGHFFAAAAEAMRRILIDQARRKCSAKRGGVRRRVALDEAATLAAISPVFADGWGWNVKFYSKKT